MTVKEDTLTQARVRELLDYDPDSGLFHWKVSRSRNAKAGCVAGYLEATGYVRITIDGARYLAHRLAWFLTHGVWHSCIDHKNRNCSDNRLCNLRPATKAENSRNSRLRLNNRCGFKGVYYRPTVTYRDGATSLRASPFCASIRVGGRQRNLGYFKTPEDAHAAYVAAAKTHFGDFWRSA
jgi:hypothetical protein